MKDEILNYIEMTDVLDKYGIENKGRMYRCPFHGEDKKPSATVYSRFFHCFCCQKHLDVIGFVQEYFNLSFKEAMQKLNMDFNLSLEPYKVDYKKLKQIKHIQNEKKIKKLRLQKKHSDLCNLKREYLKLINDLSKKINIHNWETIISMQLYFNSKILHVNDILIELEDILSSRM